MSAALRGALLGALMGGVTLGPAGTARAEVSRELLTALSLARPTARLEAPDFKLPDLAGKLVRLADLRGRAVLLYFWTTW